MMSVSCQIENTAGFPYNRPRFAIVSLAIFGLALSLRLYNLGAEDFWHDEALSAHFIAEASWQPLVIGNTPPLYYVLLKIWSVLAGDSEFGLRALSAAAGSLLVLATIWMGKEVFNEFVGLWSGLFVAVNPMQIYYSQEARAYALLLLLLVLAYTQLWIALKRGAPRNWVCFSLFSLLALYSHYLALLALAPTVLLVLLWPAQERRGSPWIHYGCAVVACAVLLAPMVIAKLFAAHEIAGLDWIERTGRDRPLWLLIPSSLEVFGLGAHSGVAYIFFKQLTLLHFPLSLRVVGISILVLLAGAALIPRGDHRLGIPWIGRRKLWLVTLVCVPLLLLLGISFTRSLYVVGRYDMIGFPGYAIVLGLGAAKIQRIDRFGPWVMTGMALCLLGVIATKLVLYYRTSTPSHQAHARVTASFLNANVKSGDMVVFTKLRGPLVIYYLRRLGYSWKAGRCVDGENGRVFGCRLFPPEGESNLGAYDARRVMNSRVEVRSDLRSFLQGLEGSGSSFWVVLGGGRYKPHGFEITPPDSLLMTELMDLGYAFERPPQAHHIFRFDKSPKSN